MVTGVDTNHGSTVLLFLFTLVYAGLIFFVAFFLFLLASRTPHLTSGYLFLRLLVVTRLRWGWLILMVNLAGLPPALFFGPKLGLLVLLLSSGVLTLSLFSVTGIFLGWAVYYSLSHRMLQGLGGGVVLVSRKQQLGVLSLNWLVAATFILAMGGVWLDEFFLLALWLV
jgi:NADH:ubiquinone oxidoreductase subunit 2 (subunit N)